MAMKIVYALIFIVVLAAVWFFLDRSYAPLVESPLATVSPYVSPMSSVSPTASVAPEAQFEQDLDASLQGDIDAEFQSIDEDASQL